MGKGGSRFGAGRPGWRRKCEYLLALDVRVLARRWRLARGLSYSWAWSRGGEPAGEYQHSYRQRSRATGLHVEPLRFRASTSRLLSAARVHALPLRGLSTLVQVSPLLGAPCSHLRRSD